MKYSKFLLILQMSLLSFYLNGQNNYIPPHRNGVSQHTYDKWVRRIKHYREQLKKTDIEDKTRIVLKFNLANGYMMLGEPADSIYNRLYDIILLDTSFVCYEIIDGNSAHQSFGIMSYEELSPKKWEKVYKLCSPYAQELEEEHERRLKEDEAQINPILLRQLRLLRERDSRYRIQINEKSKELGENHIAIQALREKQLILDSLNVILADSLIDAHNGYMDDSILGYYHRNDLLFIALHCNSIEFLDKHFPMFKQLALKRKVSGELFKILCDRYHLQKYGMQIFGTQSSFSEDRTMCKPAPLYPEEELKRLKKELGFQ